MCESKYPLLDSKYSQRVASFQLEQGSAGTCRKKTEDRGASAGHGVRYSEDTVQICYLWLPCRGELKPRNDHLFSHRASRWQ